MLPRGALPLGFTSRPYKLLPLQAPPTAAARGMGRSPACGAARGVVVPAHAPHMLSHTPQPANSVTCSGQVGFTQSKALLYQINAGISIQHMI